MSGKGRWTPTSMFYEFNNNEAPFTLRDEDHLARSGKEYKSVAEIYRNSIDEYDAAMKIVGSMRKWRKLCSCEWFMNGKDMGGYTLEGLKHWRDEMKMRDESRAKAQLMNEASEGNVAAQRFLYEKAAKASKPVGRPEKKKVVPSKVTSLEERFKQIKEK